MLILCTIYLLYWIRINLLVVNKISRFLFSLPTFSSSSLMLMKINVNLKSLKLLLMLQQDFLLGLFQWDMGQRYVEDSHQRSSDMVCLCFAMCQTELKLKLALQI